MSLICSVRDYLLCFEQQKVQTVGDDTAFVCDEVISDQLRGKGKKVGVNQF